jgi:glutathione S-transferase
MAALRPLTLVSHALCPYVQRAAIVLTEKGVAFERRDVDLSDKPDWFVQISPLGKTPVLLVGGEPIFESAVICEYLDETVAPALHPNEPLQRARDRAWMEFGSVLLDTIGSFYNAPDDVALIGKAREIRARFARLEAVLGQGPYFDGPRFGMVDAVFGPVFRYFDVFGSIDDFGFFTDLPKVTPLGAGSGAARISPAPARLPAGQEVRAVAAHGREHAAMPCNVMMAFGANAPARTPADCSGSDATRRARTAAAPCRWSGSAAAG